MRARGRGVPALRRPGVERHVPVHHRGRRDRRGDDPGGAAVQLTLGSANRDAARFPDAASSTSTRDATGHVAFGHGIHFCLGAPLARIEGEVALSALLARFPALELAVDPAALVFRRSTLVRGLRELPVRAARS